MSFSAATIPAFRPPADLDDFTEETRKIWSEKYIAMWMDGEINADQSVVSPGRTALTQYFNGTVTPFNVAQTPSPAKWKAFPKLVASAYNGTPLRWQVADASRMFQDEYLEWSVNRNDDDEIINAEFTCEGPEYWQVFASYQKEDFLKKVREMNPDRANDMNDSDFFLKDPKTGAEVYNPYNYWNIWSTSGSICHLIQPNNTLGAEIDIAAQATVIRGKGGKPVTDGNQLILCSKYGNPGRNSDPTIGATVNTLARGGQSVSVADPVALYINSVDWSNFMYDTVDTDGEAEQANLIPIPNPEEVFKCVRGDLYGQPKGAGQGLRLHVKVPDGVTGKDGQQLNVSNIYDTSTNYHIRYAAQIADYVTMAVSVVTLQGEAAAPQPCYDPQAATNLRVNPKKNTHKFL